MRYKTQLSRADLLACLQEHGEAQLEQFAAVLGYARREPPQTVQSSSRIIRVTANMRRTPSEPSVPAPAPVSRVRFYRVVAQRQLEPTEVVRNEPDWFRQATPYSEDSEELRAVAGITPPPQPPLMHWARLWPFLKTALGAQQATQTLDMPRIVDHLARGQALRHLPRQLHQGWAPVCQILIDYAVPLLPFWTDYNEVHQRLRQLRGIQGLALFAFLDGDPGGRCALYTPQGWQEIEHYRIPAPGTPVLVLSDLGCIDASEVRRRRWCRLGARLRRAGCCAVALMPCPRRWWDRELTRLFYPVCWDRAVRPPRRLGVHQIGPAPETPAERDTDAEPLLNLLGAAIRVEPALLRAVRYLLPAQQADVGSEAAAWNHPHVHATPLAFYYDQDVTAHYRTAFARQAPPLRQQVAAMLTAYHASLSPAIGYEEQLLLAEGDSVSDAYQPQRFLERLVKTLHAQDGAFVDAMRSWVHRMARRQHHTPMWHNEALAATWATVHLAQLRAGEPLTLPAGLELARVSWLLAQDLAPRRYTLRQRGQTLYVEAEAPATTTTVLDTPGSPLSTISAIAPYMQVQQGATDGAASTAQLQPLDWTIPLPVNAHVLLRTDHEELTIDSIPRPTWAEGIGRDAQGLWATWAGGERRAYWLPPGHYPVYNHAGERLGQLELPQGYWCDEAEGLTQLREGLQQPPWAEDYGLDDYGLYAGFRIKGVYQRMRWIAPGEFVMGSPETEAERFDNETPHCVILSRSFWLADTTCTQALWQAVLGENPSYSRGEDRPVENVSWDDVQRFLTRLNDTAPELAFRLPTEAEWEYARRAGTTSPFWFGEQITPEQANYDGNYPYARGKKGLYRAETVPVKALPCNGWGLYQMHGNVWEWCQDRYGAYPTGTVVDPTGPDEGAGRVLRGGSWFDDGGDVRSAQRDAYVPGLRSGSLGFRLARGQAAGRPAPEAQAEWR
jgi:formylglycine-generating enzyme required for sulfatase activity